MHKIQIKQEDGRYKTSVGLYHFGNYLNGNVSRPLTNAEAKGIFERLQLKLSQYQLKLISL